MIPAVKTVEVLAPPNPDDMVEPGESILVRVKLDDESGEPYNAELMFDSVHMRLVSLWPSELVGIEKEVE